MKRLLSAVLSVAFVVGALSGCSDRPDPGPGEARLRELRGRVEISEDGRTWRAARDGLLHRGERVRVRGDGSALLDLNRGGRLELRDGSHVVLGSPLRLVSGDLLVDAGRTAVRVGDGTATADVAADGAGRLTRGSALDVRTFVGLVTVRSAGRSLKVPAYRQASVGGTGLVPQRAEPLRYSEDDPWDRRYLGDWIDLGRDLDSRSRGLTGQLGVGQGQTPGFYRLVVPELEDEPFGDDLLQTPGLPAAVGERLVGTLIALSGEGGSFDGRWREVFSFRGEGAEWGLVAADQQVDDVPDLVNRIDQALSRAVVRPELAVAAPIVASNPVAPVDGGSGGGGGSSPPVTQPPSAPPTSQPPRTPPTTQPPVIPIPVPTLPPPPSGDQDDDDGPIGELTDPLVEAVGGVLDGLLNPAPPPP